jgi:DNA-binding ferritin-like protein (Dps family)
MSLKLNTLQIEKLPGTNDTETWAKFNERINNLANQGYIVLRATETYILFSRKKAASRREE